MNTKWPIAIGREVASREARPVAAPANESTACVAARASAMASAKWPSSGIISADRAFLPGEGVPVDLVAGLLQRVRGFRRHVVLVVLGEHLGGPEGAIRGETA